MPDQTGIFVVEDVILRLSQAFVCGGERQQLLVQKRRDLSVLRRGDDLFVPCIEHLREELIVILAVASVPLIRIKGVIEVEAFEHRAREVLGREGDSLVLANGGAKAEELGEDRYLPIQILCAALVHADGADRIKLSNVVPVPDSKELHEACLPADTDPFTRRVLLEVHSVPLEHCCVPSARCRRGHYSPHKGIRANHWCPGPASGWACSSRATTSASIGRLRRRRSGRLGVANLRFPENSRMDPENAEARRRCRLRTDD